MVNELYLSTAFRPTAGLARGLTCQLLKRTQPSSAALELDDALDACEKLRGTLLASLSRDEPEVLAMTRPAEPTRRHLTYFPLLLMGICGKSRCRGYFEVAVGLSRSWSVRVSLRRSVQSLKARPASARERVKDSPTGLRRES
jgi:hypothetical protein